MIYSVTEIKEKVKPVADRYDIREIRLFGSYFDETANESSDLDFIVRYGKNCRGLTRIKFMNDLETSLGKKVDVINIDFPPTFMKTMNLDDKRRQIYVKAK